MQRRFVSIWFKNLKTDWLIRKQPDLHNASFVLVAPDHGRMMITAASILSQKQGIEPGMALADARAISPNLLHFEEEPVRPAKLLAALAEWLIRFTPVVATDLPDGLMLDATGCTHLWGGEKQYLTDIYKRLMALGYHIDIAIADTIGCAWAVARYGKGSHIIGPAGQSKAIRLLPADALRMEWNITGRLEKLGLGQVGDFMNIPRPSLRRRFGTQLLLRLDQALGNVEETLLPVQPLIDFEERLPCFEPIVTATGIRIALQKTLDLLCERLKKEEKGLRKAILKCFRIDNRISTIGIGTNRPTADSRHLLRLLEEKINEIEPGPGIELFILEAPVVEAMDPVQEKLFEAAGGLNDTGLAKLLDRISVKLGADHIHRYLPAEHYWPERSFKLARSLTEVLPGWNSGRPRPLQLLAIPELIEVTAPIPDYPPMLFRYKGKIHKIAKADGPERIEQEWWLQQGQHRDYYYVEDEQGKRYWLFRLGHYDTGKTYQWFLHGFFA